MSRDTSSNLLHLAQAETTSTAVAVKRRGRGLHSRRSSGANSLSPARLKRLEAHGGGGGGGGGEGGTQRGRSRVATTTAATTRGRKAAVGVRFVCFADFSRCACDRRGGCLVGRRWRWWVGVVDLRVRAVWRNATCMHLEKEHHVHVSLRVLIGLGWVGSFFFFFATWGGTTIYCRMLQRWS